MSTLSEKADWVRREVFRVATKNGCGHIAPSLSCVDILVALFYGLNIDPMDLVISKAHGAYGLYPILVDLGYLPAEQWEHFGTPKSQLTGCLSAAPEWGIPAGCGSLGHGLPIAVGMAYAAPVRQIYCIMGDGETEEGTTHEAAIFWNEYVSNLQLIIDGNNLMGMGLTEEHWPFPDNLGHGTERSNPQDIADKLQKRDVLLVMTTKGHGFNCMENKAKFHYRLPGCAMLSHPSEI